MNKKNKFAFPESKLYLVFIFILAATLLYYDRLMGLTALFVLIYLIYYNYDQIKSKNSAFLADLKNLSLEMNLIAKNVMLDFPLPLCVMDKNGVILWHNTALAELFSQKSLMDKNMSYHLKSYDIYRFLPNDKEEEKKVDDFKIKDKTYVVKTLSLKRKGEEAQKYAMYFFDVTYEKKLLEMYNHIKPVVMNIQIDSYEEVMNSTLDENKGMLMTQIDKHLRGRVEAKNGMLFKYANDRYVAVLSEKYLNEMENEKFAILDEIRDIEMSNSIPVTISIGVSGYDTDISETNKNSISALEMALARGGDQAVLKKDEKMFFYGGRTKAVEKQTRVKARIVGHALRDLILSSERVLIMGHKNPDMDALGSAMGIANICRILKKTFYIIMDKTNTSIEVMYDDIMADGIYKDAFVNHEQAKRILQGASNTLVVVVDTHRTSSTDFPPALDIADKVAFIDHHRRGMEYIENAALSYHETYASSASELVTELVQYIKDNPAMDKIAANCLMGGIMLDTKNFSKKAGVRTFEAAAYLKKKGADVLQVRKYFRGDYDNFLIKARAIKNVELYRENIALTSCEDISENPALIASQIADELLEITGVEASFVAANIDGNTVHISARSFENMNVQLICEKLGGGGHLDTAATQLKGISTDEALIKVKNAIDEYFDEESKFGKITKIA